MSKFMSDEEAAALYASGIGPCLIKFLGFTCSLVSNHDGDHEALGPHGETANWPRAVDIEGARTVIQKI